jgi:DNA-binding response OmpR family regulator
MVREKIQRVVTTHGAHARSLTRQFNPLAIMLDIFLPDMLGWTVLNHLKQDPATRHIPVQVISVEDERMQGLGHGAFNYLIKPATTDELKKAFDRVLDYLNPATAACSSSRTTRSSARASSSCSTTQA